MKVLGYKGHVEPRFGLYGESVSVSVHCLTEDTTALENILDAHDGTAR
jgi:hypothetical protein